MEIDRGAGGRVTQRHPVSRGGFSRVLSTSVSPRAVKGVASFPTGAVANTKRAKHRHQCIHKEVTSC